VLYINQERMEGNKDRKKVEKNKNRQRQRVSLSSKKQDYVTEFGLRHSVGQTYYRPFSVQFPIRLGVHIISYIIQRDQSTTIIIPRLYPASIFQLSEHRFDLVADLAPVS